MKCLGSSGSLAEPAVSSDVALAGEVERREREARELRERHEFQQLQAQYGFQPGRSIRQQGERALFSAVQRGHMSLVEYHEKRIRHSLAERGGVDDSSSATLGQGLPGFVPSFSLSNGTVFDSPSVHQRRCFAQVPIAWFPLVFRRFDRFAVAVLGDSQRQARSLGQSDGPLRLLSRRHRLGLRLSVRFLFGIDPI